jgi:hypothetical protein
MVQAQRPDLVIVDPLVYGWFRIALVELTCPWGMDAKRAKELKTARYADPKEELSNQGWDCSLYLIKVKARGHIVKSVKVGLCRYSALGLLLVIGQVLGR